MNIFMILSGKRKIEMDYFILFYTNMEIKYLETLFEWLYKIVVALVIDNQSFKLALFT